MRTNSALAGILVLGVAFPALAQQRDHGEEHGGPGQMHGERPRAGAQPQQAPQPHPQPQPQQNVQHAQPRPGPAPAPGGAMRGAPPPAPPQPMRQGQPPGAANRPSPQQRYAPPARPAAEARSWNQQGGWRQQQGAWQQHSTWQEHRSEHWQDDHRGWAQRGGYGGAYIPAPRFERSFGPRHYFHMHARPVIYDGYPRFSYGGYNFLIVDPWPAYWSDSWYQSDDLYIAYDGDGYYLHNRRYPDMALAVTVTL